MNNNFESMGVDQGQAERLQNLRHLGEYLNKPLIDTSNERVAEESKRGGAYLANLISPAQRVEALAQLENIVRGN